MRPSSEVWSRAGTSSAPRPSARAARNAARSCPGSAPTRSAIWSRREPGRQREDGVVAAAAAAVDGPRAERVDARATRPCSGGAVGAGLERAARLTPSPRSGTRATEPITPRRLQRVAGLARAPPGLDLDRRPPAPGTAGRVELPDEPAAGHEEREDEDREDGDDRPRAASAAGPVGATGPVAAAPASPTRGDRSDRRGVPMSVGRFGDRGSARRSHRSAIAAIGGVGTRASNRSANRSQDSAVAGLAGRPSHDSSWPPSSVGVTRAARTAERRATTAGSRRPPTASIVVALRAPATLRRRVGISEVALGDHRGEALIVGVDLDALGARQRPQRLDLGRAPPAPPGPRRPRARAAARPRSCRRRPRAAAARIARWSSADRSPPRCSAA